VLISIKKQVRKIDVGIVVQLSRRSSCVSLQFSFAVLIVQLQLKTSVYST
jgi:hypothetical protein